MTERTEENDPLALEILHATLEGACQSQDGKGQSHHSGCVPLSHQVAGHRHGIGKMGILQHPDGTLLKHLQPAPRGPREMDFYMQVFAEDCSDPQLLALRTHLPNFYGTWASPGAPGDIYLRLEDLARRFTRPCIMDVKIGRQSYDPLAPPEKREQQIRKYPLMEEIGFLILGMRVYQLRQDSYVSYDQMFGRRLVRETLAGGLSQFFHNGERLRKDVIHQCICKVRNILRWFENQTQLHFYASSLLFVYEGACSLPSPVEHINNNNNNNDCPSHLYPPRGHSSISHPVKCSLGRGGIYECLHATNHNGARLHNTHPIVLGQKNGHEEVGRKMEDNREMMEKGTNGCRQLSECEGTSGVEVRMIDFAHVFPSQSSDEGYMHGLRNLLSTLESILTA